MWRLPQKLRYPKAFWRKKENWVTDSLKNISLKELYAHLPGRTLTYNKTEVTHSAHP